MKHEAQGSNNGWVATVALVIVVLGTHVVLAQTTDIEGWARSAIAIAVGIAVATLATIITGRRKKPDSTPQN